MTDDINIKTISARELREALKQEHPPIVLDVREAEEVAICALPTILHIPLGELAHALDRIPHDQVIVTLCHHGFRSHRAAVFLKQNGFEEILNLTGGIDAWAHEVDLKMTRY
jgi:rhodanese-related sulfurtransferase